ncbi:hypothetical protein ABIC66_002040 [Caulobacter sp. 1776]
MRSLTPLSPAKAGAQIQPEHLGQMRLAAPSGAQALAGSIWIPAFAGTVGSARGRSA